MTPVTIRPALYFIVAASVAVIVSGCTANPGPPRPATMTPSYSPTATTKPTDVTRHWPTTTPVANPSGRYCSQTLFPLPDPVCTPGATSDAVTQDNIQQTICSPLYTKKVRPPTSYTGPLKLQMMKDYGLADPPSDVSLDHLIPLEIGGAPQNPANLWPEKHDSLGSGSQSKDKVENDLHRAVCSGKVSLTAAQQAIAKNWTTAEQVLGLQH
jgi:hypothetical protein